jgi:hypothetical protein
MKDLLKLPLTFMVCALLTFSCSDDEKESEQQRTVRLLTKGGTWTLASADVDGTDETQRYGGLTLEFSTSGYTTTNGGAIWPATGTWTFEEGASNTMVRDDGVIMEIKTLDEETLVIGFTWEKETFGEADRQRSIRGNHSFSFMHP